MRRCATPTPRCVQAAIALGDAATAAERARFYALARRGRPAGRRRRRPHGRAPPPRARATASGSARSRRERYRVEVDGAPSRSSVERARPSTSGGSSYGGRSLPHGDRACRTPTCWSRSTACRTASRATRAAWSAATAPAVVVAIPVSAGDEVQAGDVVAVAESMKMETSLTAPFAGRVREVLVGRERRTSPPRTPLVQIEPLDGGGGRRGERRADLVPGARRRAPGAPQRCRENLSGSSGSCSATT